MTYDLADVATLQGWSVRLAVVGIAWGHGAVCDGRHAELSARDARAGILSGATVGGIQRALGSEPLT